MTEPPILMPKHRLEALADGIFAIAMTILVLEVRVPDLVDPRSSSEFLTKLRHAWPTLAAYFFSFFMLGYFWVWHHRLAAKLRRLDLPSLLMSLFFLALVSFFPFAAAVMGRYPLNAASLMVYLPTIGLILATQTSFFGWAMAKDLVDPDIPIAEVRRAHLRNLRGCAIFFLSASPSAIRLGWPHLAASLSIGIGFLVWARRYRRV